MPSPTLPGQLDPSPTSVNGPPPSSAHPNHHFFFGPPNAPGPSARAYVQPPQPHQPTALLEMFNAMSLGVPANDGWYMDTGATSHLHANQGILKTVLNNFSNFSSSVLVGDGSSITVSKIGHSFLPHPYRPLILRNILITPQIIKNLIFVRRFTCDNIVSIEFDPYGFTLKDLQTNRILMRCDSTGDLYPVTAPSRQALLSVAPLIWHLRLGHPDRHVFKTLVDNHSILCSNNNKITSVCHSFQMGKHVRLPFSLSNSVLVSPFDLVHSDVWTSPVTSISGIKYYVIFLHNFSHIIWVYSLRYKSDAFSKFVHFYQYVKTQFKTEIQSFKCDNGRDTTIINSIIFVMKMAFVFVFHALTHLNKMENLSIF